MSFWGAMVFTSLLGAIPIIGDDLLFLFWGGFAIDNTTLHRFYSLHFVLPFVLLALTVVHIALLHEFGSSNPLGIINRLDFTVFVPYYLLKDILSLYVVLISFVYIVSNYPLIFANPDNFIKANPLYTPPHIVPE